MTPAIQIFWCTYIIMHTTIRDRYYHNIDIIVGFYMTSAMQIYVCIYILFHYIVYTILVDIFIYIHYFRLLYDTCNADLCVCLLLYCYYITI